MDEEKITLSDEPLTSSDILENEHLNKKLSYFSESRECYPTGFRSIDTNVAFRVYDDNTDELLHTNRGVLSGSWITAVGVSGSGKTTLGLQMLSGMMNPFIKSGDARVKLHVIDLEKGVHANRIKALTGWTDRIIHDHVVFENDLTIEGMMKTISSIIEMKSAKGYRTDERLGTSGRMTSIFHPTFILIDSVSEMVSDKALDDLESHDNTMYFRRNLVLDGFMKKYKALMVKYNIVVYAVSHLSDKIDVGGNPMAKPVRQWKGIESNKKISAGKAVEYATDIGIYINRIEAADEKAVERSGAKTLDASSIKEAKLFKNRQGLDNIKFFLVTDKKGKFDQLGSFIYDAQDLKVIVASGVMRTVAGTQQKCRSQDLKEKIITDVEFRTALFTEYDRVKENGLESVRMSKQERDRLNDILDVMSL